VAATGMWSDAVSIAEPYDSCLMALDRHSTRSVHAGVRFFCCAACTLTCSCIRAIRGVLRGSSVATLQQEWCTCRSSGI
jgi:hypothetical protein